MKPGLLAQVIADVRTWQRKTGNEEPLLDPLTSAYAHAMSLARGLAAELSEFDLVPGGDGGPCDVPSDVPEPIRSRLTALQACFRATCSTVMNLRVMLTERGGQAC